MIKEKQPSMGQLTLIVKGKNGEVKHEETFRNLIVDDGREVFADRLKSDTQAYVKAIALGTGVAAPDAGDSALGAEPGTLTGTVRKAVTPAAGATPNIVRFSSVFGPTEATGTIEEAGLFCDTVKGGGDDKIVARVTTGGIPKDADDTVTGIWEITFSP